MNWKANVATLFLIFFFPLLLYILNLACNKEFCLIHNLPTLWPEKRYFSDQTSYVLVILWIAFQFMLAHLRLPFSSIESNQLLPHGETFTYLCNGFSAAVVSVLLFVLLWMAGFPVTSLYDIHTEIMCSLMVVSFVLSLFFFYHSRTICSDHLSVSGNSGCVTHDFYMGRGLVHRISSIDMKFFLELRPGMIGWLILNVLYLMISYERLGYVPVSAVVIIALHSAYILDALWFEPTLAGSLDMTYEGLGFMLIFGDLVWVPFTSTLLTRFLLEHGDNMTAHYSMLILSVILFLIGWFINRTSTRQKYLFRKHRSRNPLLWVRYISRTRNRTVLLAGWFGRCRSPDYFGQIIMALAWVLPCGLHHFHTFLYLILFIILIIKREERDNQIHRALFGSEWHCYCNRVKSRIIPYIY